MRKVVSIFIALFISLSALAQTADPMGLSDYVVFEVYSPTTGKYDEHAHTTHERRLTNHEVDRFVALGFIDKDGAVSPLSNTLKREPLPPVQPISATQKTSKLNKSKGSLKHVPQKKPTIKKKPLPNHKAIAKQTKTRHRDHPESRGTVEVRPKNFPKNPTRDEIVKMQQHIQHIERTVGKALDLSLSAYAVAELPQATQGRSGISVGFSSSGGQTGAAIGLSSNFGDTHEYTVKTSLSHAGHTDAMGAGFGWQW